MTISASSTVQDVLDAHNDYAPTSTEIKAWNTLTKYVSADSTVARVGLFGADLTKFNEDCLLSTLCAAKDYSAWNGWAIGVNWADGEAYTVSGLVIADNLLAAEITWRPTTNVLAAFTIDSGKVSATAPLAADCHAAIANDPFEGWTGKPTKAGSD